MKKIATVLIVALLAACSEPAPPPPAPAPAPKPKPAPTISIAAPAGHYAIDPHHNTLAFKLSHVGLAPYVARFTKVDATLTLDPENVTASKISVTVDPLSVRTDFSGDYKATHQGTPYNSFEEAIGKDEKFLNAKAFPQITFNSTGVSVSGDNRLKVTGDLTFLGQTRPLTLDVTVFGSLAAHPWTKKGAIGFSATGSFKRSTFGMQSMQGPLGDDVQIEFDGEFHQQDPATTTEVPADGEVEGSTGTGTEGKAAAESAADGVPTEADYQY